MYSEKITLRNIEEFAAREGWCPVYHSYDEVREFCAHIDSLINVETNSKSSYITLKNAKGLGGRQRRELSRWIENEQVLCGLDSSYWERNYAFVCDEKAQIYKFKNRKSQEVFDAIISDFDEREVSIELLILKARQVGISTKTALKFIHRLMFIPHTQAVMASVQKDKSELIGRILDTAYNRSPWWLVPRRMPKRSFDNGSILSIQSGMQPTGLAQGWTPSCLVPDAPIRLADGQVKAINRVESGDEITTHCGHRASVKRAWLARRDQPTKVVKLWGNYEPLECTLDHPIYTPTGWVEAEDLEAGEYVSVPLKQISGDLTATEMIHLPRGLVTADRMERFSFPLTPELGYLCGFYLAEGSCHRSAVGHKTKKPYYSQLVFSIHQRESENTVAAIRAVLGADQHVSTRNKRGNGAAVSVSCAWLTRWMAENFGTKADKKVPDWVWSAGEEFCAQILKGYMDGDGHCPPDSNMVIAPSICRPVVMQMRDLVASLRMGWASIYHRDAHRSKDGQFHRECWKLVLSGPCGYRYRKSFDLPTISSRGRGRHWCYGDAEGTRMYVQVESVTDGFSDEVWDIEVDHPAHSFLTAQCAVHNCVHVSELADIPNPKVTIEEGLFRAAHSSKNLFMVLEGTGGGNTGWLADTWRTSKDDFPKGLARLCPVFIPWAMCPDIYPEEDWLRKFPVPGGWRPHETTRKHIIKCEAFIRNSPYLAKVAGRDWRMPIEQQWFWQFNYDEACKKHTQKTWAAQMPADDFEALTGKHDSVFDPEVLMEAEDRIYEVLSDGQRVRKLPMGAYAITGHDVDEAFEPSDDRIDHSKEFIRVEWDSYRGQHYEWTMVPLLLDDEEKERNTMDCLMIYEWPKNGSYYACGVDTADGLGKEDEERSCLSVAKNRFGGQSDQQVAELTSNRINSAQIVAFAACVGALYGPSCPDNRGMKFCIEQIQGPGDTCQHQLKMMGFFNHHRPRRYDSKKIKDDSSRKEGWYSSAWSVPMLMTRFVEAVNGGWYEPRSKWLIEELRTLERHETAGRSKMEHQSGRFDDRVRAAAQSYFTAHDMDVLTDRAQKRYAAPVRKMAVSKSACTANQVSVGGW